MSTYQQKLDAIGLSIAELIAETRKAKDFYESELKKIRTCMEEWENICRKQGVRGTRHVMTVRCR